MTELFGEQTPEVLPYLATLLSLPVPEALAEKVQHLDGEAMGRQLYRASRLYFARLAEERPLVVAFEDVHWMDASSAELLEHLLPLIRRGPDPLLLRLPAGARQPTRPSAGAGEDGLCRRAPVTSRSRPSRRPRARRWCGS